MSKSARSSRADVLIREALVKPSRSAPLFTTSHRGWIAPDGTYHKVGAMATHPLWVKQNPEIVRAPVGDWPSSSGIEISHRMLTQGWVRKVAPNHYHIHQPRHVEHALAHVREHHPEIQKVHLTVNHGKFVTDVIDDPNHNYTVPVNGTYDKSYHLAPFKMKRKKIPNEFDLDTKGIPAKYRGVEEARTVDDEPDNEDSAASDAWHRRHDLVQRYKSKSKPFGNSDVMGFIKKAREKKATLKGSKFVEAAWDIPTLRPNSPSWMLSREAAWITPTGEYHPLSKGQHHYQWLRANGHIRDGEQAGSHAFVHKGWIRKSARNVYWARPQDMDRVTAHVAKRHPNVHMIRVFHVNDSDGKSNTPQLYRKDYSGRFVNENVDCDAAVQTSRNEEESTKRLVMMRGLPGSGKSHRAREIAGLTGKVFSTDDYFGTPYKFDGSKLKDAHEWNQKRAEGAMMNGHPLVVIDNTNVKHEHMKPYLELAKRHGYQVSYEYSKAPWAWDTKECASRNTHGVPLGAIERMKRDFEEEVKTSRADLLIQHTLKESEVAGLGQRSTQLTRGAYTLGREPHHTDHDIKTAHQWVLQKRLCGESTQKDLNETLSPIKILIARHAESEANASAVLGGGSVHLSDEGGRQARALGRAVAHEHGHLGLQIVASPYRRARQTAIPIARALGHRGPVPTHKGLVERSFGVYVGKHVVDWSKIPGYLHPSGRANEHWEPPQGESLVDTQKRAVGALHELLQKYPGRNLLLVTHGHTAKALQAHFQGHWDVPRWKNAEVRSFDYVPKPIQEAYVGYKLSDESRSKLLAKFPPHYEQVRADHITTDFLGSRRTAFTPLQPKVIEVIGHAHDEKKGIHVAVVRVDGNEFQGMNPERRLHVTISHRRGVGPVHSNAAIAAGWQRLEKPFRIEAVPTESD